VQKTDDNLFALEVDGEGHVLKGRLTDWQDR
jgi:hypothetical protein